MDNFFDKVYAVARLIPYGKVCTYGAIAKFIGAPKSARMVGYALNGSIGKEDVPAHRIVNRNGLLSGKHYFGGTTVMEDLLKSEGINVLENKVQNFENHFWNPATDLKREDFLP